MQWEIVTFISGLVLAAAAGLRELVNRRKVKAEAAALDAKTPAEVDVLVATREGQEFTRMIQLNEALVGDNTRLRADNERLTGRLDTLDGTVQEVVAAQRKSDRRTSRLEGWLTAAHQHIAEFQRWGEKHAPGVKQPEPPAGYRPPTDGDDETDG